MLLVYDLELKRPGGPVLQMMRGIELDVLYRFPKRVWLNRFTPDMKLCTIGEGDLGELIEVTLKHNKKTEDDGAWPTLKIPSAL